MNILALSIDLLSVVATVGIFLYVYRLTGKIGTAVYKGLIPALGAALFIIIYNTVPDYWVPPRMDKILLTLSFWTIIFAALYLLFHSYWKAKPIVRSSYRKAKKRIKRLFAFRIRVFRT